MIKYDKLYIPAEGRGQTDYYMDREGDLVGLTEVSNKIVLTIEEASILYNTGYSAGFYDAKKESGLPYKDVPDFETYLQSKGIQL